MAGGGPMKQPLAAKVRRMRFKTILLLLLTIGCYTTVVTAVSELNIVVLIPVAVGVVVGLLGGSQLVRTLLKSYTQATYLAILGLVVGSIFTLYPGISFDMIGIVSIICMVVAFVLSYYFSEK